jgi:kynurenine formamidase
MPVYGQGSITVEKEMRRDFCRGDGCRVATFCMENHWGTHVDCPAHFYEAGKTVDQYPADFWIFCDVEVVDVVVAPGALIGIEDIPDASNYACSLLLLRTGFGKYRRDTTYWDVNPGIKPDVADYLRLRYPKLRGVGFDFISVSSFRHRGLGREAHRAFLREDEGRELLLVEDMLLPAEMSQLKTVVVAPLILKGFDASPCTVWGMSENYSTS